MSFMSNSEYQFTGSCGVSYKWALPPEKHKDMEKFLKYLSYFHREAKKAEKKLNVSVFIEAYSEVVHGAKRRGGNKTGR